jgi:hypothetical protein
LDEHIDSVLVHLLNHHVQQLNTQRHQVNGLDVVWLRANIIFQVSVVALAHQLHEMQCLLKRGKIVKR